MLVDGPLEFGGVGVTGAHVLGLQVLKLRMHIGEALLRSHPIDDMERGS